jgi:hypothetical protein
MFLLAYIWMCFPVRFPPFGGVKKTCEPRVKSIQKDQAEKYKKSIRYVGEPILF